MNRRTFLQLVAAAPLAALLPWRPPAPQNLSIPFTWSDDLHPWNQSPTYLPAIDAPPVWCTRCQRWHYPVDPVAIRDEAVRRLADAIDAQALERAYAKLDLKFLAGGTW